MGVINAYQISKGATTKKSAFTSLMYQPLQMLPESEKDDSWRSSNMDFLEWQGMKQILRNKRKFLSNYKIANAEIEKRDYIREEMEQEFVQLADRLKVEELAAMELKYYSLTDKVVDILCNEFAERVSLLTFDLRDPISFNELMDKKKDDMAQYLLQQASLKQQQKMMQMGISADSEQGKQMMDPEALKNIPQIQKFYEQDFKSTYQDWAYHCMNEDISRFNMQELEVLNFRHSLIVDREFWHFRMMENDYNIEIWNPMLVAYQKSPQCKYISGASWVIHSTEMTVPDVIDMYGWQMSEEQLLNMNRVYPLGGSLYSLNGLDNGSGQFYDTTQSKEWNTEGPGIAMRQHLSAIAASGKTTLGSNPVRDILLEGEDLVDYGDINLVRVSTIYWTTQRKMYHLTKINGEGELIQDIVGENYKVTDKPMYNTVLYKEKTANNLVFGEHLEALWVNEKWGGIKIGPNIPSWAGMTVTTGLQPMYIGYDNGKPGRLPFQFRGDADPTIGSKLPVEGCIFTDLTGNTKSRSLVDKMKPWQIPYNMVNNMIVDVSIDELGVIMAFNPDILPQHSMGEDWGKGNLQKGMEAIRSGILPTNRTMMNTDGIPDSNPIERIDLTQSNRFTSLIQRAQYFKLGALEAVGLNPTRMGTPISQEQTATEIKQAVAAASSSTEHYFSQHSDFLMPRVHQMRTDLAQYYNSTNPSIRIQYTTDSNARAWMTLNGTELMGKDFGVKCKTKTNTRAVLQQIKQFLMNNNTLADNLADHVKAMKADNMVEMDTLMADIEKRLQGQEQQRMEQEQQQHQAALDMQMQLIKEKQDWEAQQNELERQKDVYVAELQAASRAATAKTPDQGEEAYQKGLDRVEQQNQFRETMNLNQQKHLTDTLLKKQTLSIREQEIAAENARTNQQAQAKKIEAKIKQKSQQKK